MNDLLHLTYRLLESHGIKAKKGYGQNFLTDADVLDRIVKCLPADKVEQIVEIGPGLGFLSERLLAFGKPLTVIEADPDMVQILRERFGERLEIVFNDIKAVDLKTFHVKHTLFVGNLPYNITKAIVEKVVDLNSSTHFSFMVQREVGEKLHYEQGAYLNNALSAYLNLKGNIVSEIPVKRTSFNPQPKVDSVFINYELKNPEYRLQDYLFLKRLFAMPNRMIGNNLKGQAVLPEEYCRLRPHQLDLKDLEKLIKLNRSDI